MRDEYAVFILSHGRADSVKTYGALKKHGYTGEIYIVVDDSDDSISEYEERYENVVVFSKSDYYGKFDIGDAGGNESVVVYARNAMPDIAEGLGYTDYIVLDDDYTSFMFRRIVDGKLIGINVESLDDLFAELLEFRRVSNACAICIGQGGDYIGGARGQFRRRRLTRKAMNVFACSTENRFDFLGRINEDATAAVVHGSRGRLFFTDLDACIVQTQTQAQRGGLTDIYLEKGTWCKTFYTVMMAPSCVGVSLMGDTHRRIHHVTNWECAVPKIVRG